MNLILCHCDEPRIRVRAKLRDEAISVFEYVERPFALLRVTVSDFYEIIKDEPRQKKDAPKFRASFC